MLIAIMLAVVVGMAALATDGARAYAVRRDLQAALDAAALTASDKLQQTGNYSAAEQAASTIFGTNLRLYAAPACAPGYGSPGAGTFTVACTYSDGTVLTQVVSALGPRGSQFSLSAARSLPLQFARILTNGGTPNLKGTASGGVNNLLYTPTIAALNQAGCGGTSGTAISVSGGGSLVVAGDVVSNGAIAVLSGSMNVAGDIYARCQSTVAGSATSCYPSGAGAPCTFPDVVGATRSGYRLVDPVYPPPPVPGGSRPMPGNDVVISPGVYNANPNFGNKRCYFLSAGAYRWQGGYSNNGGLVSNELKPPDEPLMSDNTQPASPQFWNLDGANCAGAFTVMTDNGGGTYMGRWAVKLTSVRTETYAGTNYQRESAPSRCQSFAVRTAQNITLTISNVPGATSYNVYVSSNSCAGPFGLATNVPVTSTPQNNHTSQCPFGDGNGNGNGNNNGNGQGNGNGNGIGNPPCTLGDETLSAPAFVLPALPLPNLFALPGTGGAYPPDSETAPVANGLPNQNPDRGVAPAGDRANENQCDNTGGTLVTCAGPITPGAVVYYIPNGACLTDPNGGDNYVFSGYQYNWMAIYEPGKSFPPANTCSNVMGASTASAYIGLVYTPAAAMSIPTSSGFRVEATGGVMADTVTFTGQLPTIAGSSAYMPLPPAAKLTG
ncbi:MAG TPA: pilus assembly protein TadG-related protein [Candidatus Dormibacteraeota bacterium]|nr:pilus assembly protein TadG-related protein [Candidatus Dormibacteraeota bacterium]